MRQFLLATAAVLALAAPARAAVYLDAGSFFMAATAKNTAIIQMPSQSITITDSFGTYTNATRNDPVYVGSGGPSDYSVGRGTIMTTPTGAGQLAGNFGCFSPVNPCVGAHTITYTLPFQILGISGMLNYIFPQTPPDAIPFFGFDREAKDSKTGDYLYNSFTGFWGKTFDAPTDTFAVVWAPGVTSLDNSASFLLSGASVITAPGVVNVPEPASLAVLGMGLLGMGLVKRRRGAANLAV